MRALSLLLTLLLGLGLAPGVALADPTGKALDVDQDARAETKAGPKELVVGSDVFIGDRVVTDSRGLVQIRFSDSTKLVVGPNSALLIEDYLLREDGSGGKLAVNALSGTFRFITGGAPKGRYLIRTPTGTIGVRGTKLDIKGDGAHFTTILYEGEIVICNRGNECVTLEDVCDIGMVDVSDASILGNSTAMTPAEREQMRAMFPWATSQGALLGQFRVAEAPPCFERQVTPTQQDQVSNSGEAEPESDSDDRFN